MAAAPLTPGTVWKLALAYRWTEGGPSPRVRMSIANRCVAMWSRAPIGSDLPFPETEEDGAAQFEQQLREQADQLPPGNYTGKLEFMDPTGGQRRSFTFRVAGENLDLAGDASQNHVRMADVLVGTAMETVIRIERVQGALIDQQANHIQKLMDQTLSMGNQLIATSNHMMALMAEQQKARFEAEGRAAELEARARANDPEDRGSLRSFLDDIPPEIKEHAPALLNALVEFVTTPQGAAGAIVKGSVQ